MYRYISLYLFMYIDRQDIVLNLDYMQTYIHTYIYIRINICTYICIYIHMNIITNLSILWNQGNTDDGEIRCETLTGDIVKHQVSDK
jgi:hypothetical protein